MSTITRYSQFLLALTCFLLFTDAAGAVITVSVPKLEARQGEEVEVPIQVQGAKGMSALQLRLVYDPAALEVAQDAADPDRAITRGTIVPEKAIAKVYTETAGRLPILFLGGADPESKTLHSVREDGTLLTIRFRVKGPAGQKTALTLEKIEAFGADDMDILVRTEPGEIAITRAIPWLWIAIAVGAVLLVLLAIVRLARRKTQAPASTTAPPIQPAVPRFTPEGATTFAHTCTQCTGVIQLPLAMAGKSFQCGACGAMQTAAP